MKRKSYPSDLTDEQWALLEPLLPLRKRRKDRRGRPATTDQREVLNALFYLCREGCTWRAVPHDFPPWKTVYNYFQAWSRDGTWQRLLNTLRPQVRVKVLREPSCSAAAIDSQSVKTAEGGQAVGTDGGKKVHGRKRHILVDSIGLLIAVVVTAANVDDGQAAQAVLAQAPGGNFPRLQVVFADNKYHNYALYHWLRVHKRPYRLEIVSRPKGETKFTPLKVRWVVERAFAWLGKYRRLSKDYEHTTASSESMVRIASVHHMLRRLRPKQKTYSERFRFKRPEKQAA
jgi:putative transposase